MDEATLTSKSQITVPKAVREALDLSPGDKIQVLNSIYPSIAAQAESRA